jgi:hypothetical protein
MYSDPSGEIAIPALIFYLAIAAGMGVFGYIAVDSYNETGRVDWENAIVNGLLTFGTVYFTGMYLFSCYLHLSFMLGWNPVVGFGPGGVQYLYNYNKVGLLYPNVTDPRTGKPIPTPSGNYNVVDISKRVEWKTGYRDAYITEWHDRGYAEPSGGWKSYDVHHIIPREYGGTNDFWNLVPVIRGVHQQEFNLWWAKFK